MNNSTKYVLGYLVFVGFVLLVPLIGMQFTPQVNWTAFDFAVAAIMLLGAGLLYWLFSLVIRSRAQRIVLGLIAATILAAIWVELAVGIFD
jgi:pilus assembly protein TadC